MLSEGASGVPTKGYWKRKRENLKWKKASLHGRMGHGAIGMG